MTYILKHPYQVKKICVGCKKEYIARAKNQLVCYNCKDNYKLSITNNLPIGTVGAISEILVSADLLKKGYEVFRAISPSCSCDLAMLKDNKLLRVEVRTGRNSATGKLYYSSNMRADIMAVVIHKTNEIIYIPKIDEKNKVKNIKKGIT